VQGKNSQSNNLSLEYLFHPKSIAIVGVSSDVTKPNWGREFLKSLTNTRFKGKIYPVGLDENEMFGFKIYPSIKDIPDTIDYVTLAIPAQHTPQLVADCAAKGVKAIHMFTAGFSETGDDEKRQLELEIAALARQSGIRIIGPNCMGLYCPKTGLSFSTDLARESGSVGFISQSGGNSQYAIREGAVRGVYFSKVISYGNACDLNETDFLEYLIDDPDTKIITLYIEGIKDGRRFLKTLRQATKVKPVIVYKGGNTEAGRGAAASHTGSIAGSAKIWASLLRQVGAIQVHNIDEILDMALLFTFMFPPKGKNTAIIGIGGGASVLVADECSNAGLIVPGFPAEIRRRLAAICTTEAGSSFKNPLDIFPTLPRDFIQRLIRVVANYDQVDLLFIHLPLSFITSTQASLTKTYTEALINLADEINKRTVVVLHVVISPQDKEAASVIRSQLHKAGFPIYPSANQAAKAVSKFIQYYQQIKS